MFAEFARVKGANTLLDAEVMALDAKLADLTDLEKRSRYLVERLALALQAATLLGSGNDLVAESFCQSRLGLDRGSSFGTLPPTLPLEALISRAYV
jgi:putative acyl-CoA dehydrogenase